MNPQPQSTTCFSFYAECKYFQKIKQDTRFRERFFPTDPRLKPPQQSVYISVSENHPAAEPAGKNTDHLQQASWPAPSGFPESGSLYFSFPMAGSFPVFPTRIQESVFSDCSKEGKFFSEITPENPDTGTNRKEPNIQENNYLQIKKDVIAENQDKNQIQLIVNFFHSSILTQEAFGILLDQLAGAFPSIRDRGRRADFVQMFSFIFRSIPRNIQQQFILFLESSEADAMRKSLGAALHRMRLDRDCSRQECLRAETMLAFLEFPRGIVGRGKFDQPKTGDFQLSQMYDVALFTPENKLFLRRCGFQFSWLE